MEKTEKEKLLIRVVAIAALFLAVWVGAASYRSLERTRTIDQEIAKLEDEAQRIERENATLREKITYFSSPNFQEREAKEKLGLKKTGEQVVVVKALPGTETEPSLIPTIDTGRTALFRSPNYYKWWKLFFE